MKNGSWWPIHSTDPAANAAIAVFLVVAAMLLLMVGGLFLLPIVIVLAIAKGVQWYVNRPVPTDQMYVQTEQRVIAANFPDHDAFVDAHLDRLLDAMRDDLPAYAVFHAIADISGAIYRQENLNNPLPPLYPAGTIAEGRYRDDLIAQQRKSVDAPRTLEIFNATLGKVYLDFVGALPPIAKATAEQFSRCDDIDAFATFPLLDVLPNVGKTVAALIAPFFAAAVEEIGLFAALRRQLDRNFRDVAAQSGTNAKPTTPDQYKGTPRDIVAAYLGNTPLEDLFYAPVPFALDDRQRCEHTHVLGGSGHGKTQLLQRLIVADLTRPQPPALIIIDSQGEMLGKIQQLQLFAPGQPLADKLISIDPEDVAFPPALNMFAAASDRVAGYSQAVKEQVEAGTVELFNYIFGAIAAELTSRQNTTFAYVTRLMLTIEGATIHTLRQLFEDAATTIDASPFGAHIRKLDATSQGFFENQFFTRGYSQTKLQIARRLYGVLQVPSFDRMFSAKENKLDMFAAMQSGKIVLVNTSKAMLKTDASALFGRYVIAQVIAAAFERVALPPEQRNPAFLLIDEAAEYFDDNMEMLLSQARKFNVGILFEHQHLDQLTPGLRAAVAANTSIKLAGGVSDRDARTLAPDMRTTADFIASMSKHAKSTDFACYVRNYTANALRLTIPFGTLEAAPKMSQADHERLIATNRERFAAGPDRPRPDATDREQPGTETPDKRSDDDDWRS